MTHDSCEYYSLLFQDKKLRIFACKTVDYFLANYKPIKANQLNSIPAIIQAHGLDGLKILIEKQKSKNTREENRRFWGFLFGVIFDESDNDYSLRKLVTDELKDKKDETGTPILNDATSFSDIKGKKKIKKENRKKVEQAMNALITIFFEHFNCHYLYKIPKERSRKK